MQHYIQVQGEDQELWAVVGPEDMGLPMGLKWLCVQVLQEDGRLIPGREFQFRWQAPVFAHDVDDIYLDQAYSMAVKYIDFMNQQIHKQRMRPIANG